MRRIILLAMVAVVMAAMVALSTSVAFAVPGGSVQSEGRNPCLADGDEIVLVDQQPPGCEHAEGRGPAGGPAA